MRMKSLFVIVLALGMMSVGCAKKMEPANSMGYTPYGPYIPPGSGPGQLPGNQLPDLTFEYGGTADLEVTSQSMYNYLGYHTNELTDVKVNINLTHYQDRESKRDYSGWGGVVTIAFKDDGVQYYDSFSSLVNPYGMVHTNGRNNQYNNWFTKNGQQYWHGFFQDQYGAIVVVLDEVVDLGDGQGPQSVSGEIWVKNHPLAYAPLSPTSCWFVSLGPYDCRTWKSGEGMNSTQSVYPLAADGYTKVGEFNDLDVDASFNTEDLL